MFFLISNFDVDPSSMPLCSPSSGCPFYYNVSGNVHFDTTANCLLDSLTPGAILPYMKVQLLQSGNVVQQEYTSGFGQYAFKVNSYGNYTVNFDTTGYPYTYLCPAAGQQAVTVSAADSVLLNQNFGVRCTHIDTFAVDYGVQSIYNFFSPFRPGKKTWVEFSGGDMAGWHNGFYCNYETPTADTSGTVTITFSGPVSYVGPAAFAIAPSSVAGNVLTYNIPNLKRLIEWPLFDPIDNGIDFILATDSTAAIGAQVCVSAHIAATVPDGNPTNDTLTRCFTVVNSWDPNHKDVVPADTFSSGDWLTYTIHFQNKGTAPAIDVVVRDTLSPYIDATSFQYIASSHKVVTQLTGSAVTFTFPQINLPDSAANALQSQGWVQYKVRSKTGLPVSTQVQNTAYIYFDLNPAVVTNTTVNVVDTPAAPLGIRQVANTGKIVLYPNPNKGWFTLQTVNSIGAEYVITDMLGNVIEQKPITANIQPVNVQNTPDGVYVLSIKGINPVRFVVVK